MILAAANGHTDCVQELLEQGADPATRRLVRIKFEANNCELLALL